MISDTIFAVAEVDGFDNLCYDTQCKYYGCVCPVDKS